MKYFRKTGLVVSVALVTTGMHYQAIAATTTLVSVTPQKIIGNDASRNISLSKSGSQCVFESDASNFALQDGNISTDIFMKVGSVISRVSVNSLGHEASNSATTFYAGTDYAYSTNPSISADGKLVAFQSNADNLDVLTLDTNNDNGAGNATDVFVRDVAKKKTYRLSGIMDGADGSVTAGQLDASGNPVTAADAPWKIMTESDDNWSGNPSIAGTAKQAWVAFESYATNLSSLTVTAGRKHIYVVDLKTKKIELIDAQHDVNGVPSLEGNGDSANPAISADGRFVVYQSAASNLVAAPVTNNVTDVFVYDRKLSSTYQLSGVLTNSVNGGYVVSTEADGNSSAPSIAGDGKSKTKSYMIAFESRAANIDSIPGGDTGTERDVFVIRFAANNLKDANSDYEIKSITRISAPLDPDTHLPTGEGRRTGSGTGNNNLNGPYAMAPVIAGNDLAYTVAFNSSYDNLIAVDPAQGYWNEDSNLTPDIYVFNSKTNAFTRANVDTAGEQGTAAARNPAISGSGKVIGFDANDDYLTPTSLGAGTQVYTRK